MNLHTTVGDVLAWFARLISGTRGRWVNSEPAARQCIYYANHSSHLDMIIIWSSLPHELRRLTRPVVARDYWEKNALRRYLAYRVFNVIMINRPGHGGSFRDAARVIDAVVEGMQDRYSLIIFPEGTRGDTDTMKPFKSGIHELARQKPGIPLIPVYLENLNRILPKGALLPVPLISSVSFGPPIVLTENETKSAFLERAREAIIELQEQ